MAGTAALVVAIECLAAARSGEAGKKVRPGPALEPVRKLLQERIAHGGEPNNVPAADLAAVADLVRSGVLATAPGLDLPFILPADPPPSARSANAARRSTAQAAHLTRLR